MVKSKLEQDIIDALEARAAEHGIDVVDVEIVGATKAPCVRVRLDKLEGDPINLGRGHRADCMGFRSPSRPSTPSRAPTRLR